MSLDKYSPIDKPPSAKSALMHLRRLSGLDWDQLAEIFGVTSHTLHLWASGQKISPENERLVFDVLAMLSIANRGGAKRNRAMLLEAKNGVTPLTLLAEHEFLKFWRVVGTGPGQVGQAHELTPQIWYTRQITLLPEVIEARRPTRPEDLVGALQDKVETPTMRASPGYAPKVKKEQL